MLYINEEYLMDLMVRMAHHSTAIEGNSLTLGETKSVLIDNYIPRAMDMRELHEVLNYKALMPFFLDSIQKHEKISLPFIREIHRILCKDAIQGVPGDFKKVPNMVIGADFEPTPPYQVIPALENWKLDLDAQIEAAGGDNAKVVETVCRQHIHFEHIHPFSDENGRVGRALMAYTCLLEKKIPVVIPVEQKKKYISYLNNNDAAGLSVFARMLQCFEQNRLSLFQSYSDGLLQVEEPRSSANEHIHSH